VVSNKMMVSTATAAGSSPDFTASADDNRISADDFLRLLIAQLTHQDPLQPMQGQEFMAQLAQLESVARLGEIRDYLQASGAATNPLSTLGRTVHWADGAGELHSAKVDAVVCTNAGGFKLVAGDWQIDFAQILRIE
jgi:flagellar basal-body rod modification protein FlgD